MEIEFVSDFYNEISDLTNKNKQLQKNQPQKVRNIPYECYIFHRKCGKLLKMY